MRAIRIKHDRGVDEVIHVGRYGVTYDVEDSGQIIWSRSVLFGRDKCHRAGGPAFREAAQCQEAKAVELAGEPW
jgi:hypothetical protein